MSKRFKNWMDRPYSNGLWLKSTVISTGIVLVIYAAIGIWTYWDNICSSIRNMKNRFLHRDEARFFEEEG